MKIIKTKNKNLGDQCYKKYLQDNCYLEEFEIYISSLLNFGDMQLCNYYVSRLRNSSLLDNADTIIISNRFRRSSQKYILPFLNKLKTKQNKIILMNNNPRFIDPPTLTELHKELSSEEINKKFYLYQDKSIIELNFSLKKISTLGNIIFFDKYSLICNNNFFSCDVLSDNHDLLFVDKDHFSKEGHIFFGKKFFIAELHNLF